MFILILNKILAILTIGAQIFVAVNVVHYLIFRKRIAMPLVEFVSKNGLGLAFIVSLVATAGSLSYSLIAGYPPCDLCWYQRIFMYPNAVLLGIAAFRKDAKIISYSLPLLIIGALISLYNNYIILFPAKTETTFCSLTSGASCTAPYVLEFGYITITMMALTAFATIITLLLLYRSDKQ